MLNQPLLNNMNLVERITFLSKINNRCGRYLKSLGTDIDTPNTREQFQKEIETAEGLIASIELELGEMSHMQNAKYRKLNKTFSSEKIKLSKYKEDFSYKSRLISVHSSTAPVEHHSPRGVEQQRGEKQILFRKYDDSSYAKREEEIYDLNAGIALVHETFEDLNELVIDQKDDIDNLENLCEGTRENIEKGNQELLQASKYQRAKRKKMCYILGCLIILGGVIALILVAGN